jgi:hypothetical protein
MSVNGTEQTNAATDIRFGSKAGVQRGAFQWPLCAH